MNKQIAKGKTEFFDNLTIHLAERQLGLGWKDAWALRLSDLGGKNRLPRGFIGQVTKGEHREVATCKLFGPDGQPVRWLPASS